MAAVMQPQPPLVPSPQHRRPKPARLATQRMSATLGQAGQVLREAWVSSPTPEPFQDAPGSASLNQTLRLQGPLPLQDMADVALDRSCSPMRSPATSPVPGAPLSARRTTSALAQSVGPASPSSWAPWSSRPSTFAAPLAPAAGREAAEAEAAAQGFNDTLQRAREEGLDIFAPAPQLTYSDMTRQLHPQHWRGTGMVQTPVDSRRLDGVLASDFFQRPAWNTSVLPERRQEDLRSLETIARQRRRKVMTTFLREKAEHGSCAQVRGSANWTPRGSASSTPRGSIEGIPGASVAASTRGSPQSPGHRPMGAAAHPRHSATAPLESRSPASPTQFAGTSTPAVGERSGHTSPKCFAATG